MQKGKQSGSTNGILSGMENFNENFEIFVISNRFKQTCELCLKRVICFSLKKPLEIFFQQNFCQEYFLA